jgi:hypothetical protein
VQIAWSLTLSTGFFIVFGACPTGSAQTDHPAQLPDLVIRSFLFSC